MKEHIYNTSDNVEVRVRYYNDRLELVIDGVTHSFTNGPVIKYVRNACNVYLEEFPLDGEVIVKEEEKKEDTIEVLPTTSEGIE